MNMIKAEKMKFSVTPASKSVSVGNAWRVRAIMKTSAIANAAPRKAAIGRTGIPSSTRSSPSQMATTAPRELPLDTPSVNGVAREFRSTA